LTTPSRGGFKFNKYFNNNSDLGTGNKGFLDVINNDTKSIYDFKFGDADWGKDKLEKHQKISMDIQLIK